MSADISEENIEESRDKPEEIKIISSEKHLKVRKCDDE